MKACVQCCRWTYFAVNWDNMIWCTHALLSSAAQLPQSTAAVTEFLVKWRTGAVVGPSCQDAVCA